MDKINDKSFAREMIKDFNADIEQLIFRKDGGVLNKTEYSLRVQDIRKKIKTVKSGYFP